MHKNIFPFLFLSLLIIGALAACTPPQTTPISTPQQPESITLVTHDSFDSGVLDKFQEETGVKVEVLKSGDAGEMLNLLLLSKDAPLGDVVYGIDNSFLSRALAGDLFQSYDSPLLAQIPDDLKLDSENRLLPVDFGYVTLNYDINWFAEKGLAPPADIKDLTQPEYKGLTVVQNPASSSPGLAFLMITVGRFGEDGEYDYLDYWRELKNNDVLVADDWSSAYFNQFTVGSGGEGDRPIVVSYATSPAAEVFFNDLPEPPSASVNTPGNSFRQIEFVGILARSPHPEMARKLVDFLLGPTFQADIPQHMWVYPANSQVDAGELFARWAQIPEQPVQIAPDEIAQKRETWLEAWTDLMLRQ